MTSAMNKQVEMGTWRRIIQTQVVYDKVSANAIGDDMPKVGKIGILKTQEVTAKCGVTFVCLCVAWYASNFEQPKAKELVQLLLNADLGEEEIAVTDRQRKLIEEASPFSVLQ